MDYSPVSFRLRELGARPRTFAARREVMKALAGGRRSACDEAALTLGAWGGPASVRVLRGLLLRGFGGEPFAWVILDRARNALLRCVSERDAEWLFDLFFGSIAPQQAEHVLALIGRLPLSVQREWIHPESISPSVARRKRAVRALAAIYLGEEQRILQRLRLDEDMGVRTMAGELCTRVAGKNRREDDDPLPRAIAPLIPSAVTKEHRLLRPVLLQEFAPSRNPCWHHAGLVQRWHLTEEGLEILPLNTWDTPFWQLEPSVSGPVSFWLSPRGDRLYLDGVLGPPWRLLSCHVRREGGTVELVREESEEENL